MGVHWKDWCWSWNSNTLATSCEELTHWKRLWCWEGLGAGGEGDDRGWDGWMASPTRWTWVWVNSGSWWWTGRPGVLRFMGSQIVRHDWATELNWTELNWRGKIIAIQAYLKKQENSQINNLTLPNSDSNWRKDCYQLRNWRVSQFKAAGDFMLNFILVEYE